MTAVLEQERGGDGRISRVDVNGGAVLPGVEKYFSEVAVLKATGASRIPDAGVLKLDKLVFASVRKPPDGLGRAPSLQTVQAVAQRTRCWRVVLAVGCL